jgi:hypothetical protein
VAMGLAMTACGGDPPSCQQAISSFYAAGCTFRDTSTNPPTETPESTALYTCSQINIEIPERCRPEFDDWKSCLEGVANDTQCTDCSQEADALFACD